MTIRAQLWRHRWGSHQSDAPYFHIERKKSKAEAHLEAVLSEMERISVYRRLPYDLCLRKSRRAADLDF